MRGTFWHLSRKSRGRATRTPTGTRSRQPNLKRLREARERSMHTTWAHPSYHTDRKTKVQCHLVHRNVVHIQPRLDVQPFRHGGDTVPALRHSEQHWPAPQRGCWWRHNFTSSELLLLTNSKGDNVKEWNHYDNTQVLLVHCSRWNCAYIMVMCILCDTSSISSSGICNSNTFFEKCSIFKPWTCMAAFVRGMAPNPFKMEQLNIWPD